MDAFLHASNPGGFRSGLIQFSADARLVLKLNDPESIFNSTIDSMDRIASTTRIDVALRLAQNEMFTAANGDRAFIPNVLFLFIDGSQTKAAGWEDPNMVTDEIRASGIDIIVIGIGNEISEFELQRLAGGDLTKVYTAKTFDEFTTTQFVRGLVNASCLGEFILDI